jgi:hypothetical protein
MKTIEEVKKELLSLKVEYGKDRVTYIVNDRFYLTIVPYKYDYYHSNMISDYGCFNVYLTEAKKMFEGRVHTFIRLEDDYRFKNHKPIKYHELPGYSSGDDMPLEHLCELIKYLYRLCDLSAFE